MKINTFKTKAETLESYADLIIEKAKIAISQKGVFNLVLSGGSSPKSVFDLLTSPERKTKVEWSKVYFFFGDERYVPADNERSNALMAQKSLFTPLSIIESQCFKMNTELPPEECAKDYYKRLLDHFKNEVISFDFIMLGMGDDSHTASLFPFTTILSDKEASVKSVYVEKFDEYRISLTAPLINNAKTIAFLVFGSKKAEGVQNVLKGEKNTDKYPSQLIDPLGGELLWFFDEEASALI